MDFMEVQQARSENESLDDFEAEYCFVQNPQPIVNENDANPELIIGAALDSIMSLASLERNPESMKRWIAELAEKNDSLEGKIDVLVKENIELHGKIEEMQNETDKAEKNSGQHKDEEANHKGLQTTLTAYGIQQLEEQIIELKGELAEKEAQLNEERSSHSETKEKLSTVRSNYDKLLQRKSKDEKVSPSKDNKNIENKSCLDMLEKVDNRSEEVLHLHLKLKGYPQKFERPPVKLEFLDPDPETAPISKSQLQFYKTDLDKSKLTNDLAAKDVSRLASNLSKVSLAPHKSSQKRSHNSSEESSIEDIEKPSTSKFRKPEFKQKGNMYICTLCSIHFASLQEVERHVNYCIGS